MALPSPSILIVDQHDPSAHQSINTALTESNAEDRIIIRPGTYTDPVTVEKNVRLIGEGPLEDIRLQVTDHTSVTIRTETCHIENISIQQTGTQESFALDIAFGNSTVIGCDISSKGLACISLHGTASPVIKANRVHGGTETGIMIAGQSQAIIDGNMVFGNEFAGIEIRDEANPQINNNHIYGENEVGILIHKHGSGKIANNSIFSNRFSGIEIRSRANPLITNNQIYYNGRSGIFSHDFATGLIEGNTISENGTSGIAIQTHSKLEVNNNTIEKSNEAGVVISDNGQGTLKRNAILGNGFSGIEISKGAVADIRDNQISWNEGGIMAHQNAGGVISNNDLRYNKNGAFYISDNSAATVTRSGNIEWIQASFN